VADEILNITTKVTEVIKSDRVRRIALTTVLSQHKPRIYVNGLASDGSKIGTYSKKYGEEKSKRGRNPGFVNLVNTGQMEADYGLIVSGEQYAFGFQNTFNADKMDWMTEKYNKEIAHLSKEELDLLLNVLTDELGK
jgi:hypothetical protein